MVDVVQVRPPGLVLAAATVAEHLQTAAKPVALRFLVWRCRRRLTRQAAGASGAINTKIAARSAEMAPKAAAIQQTGSAAAVFLIAQDAADAARMPPAPSPPTPRAKAMDHSWKQGPDQPLRRPAIRIRASRAATIATGSVTAIPRAPQQIRVAIVDPETGRPMLDP